MLQIDNHIDALVQEQVDWYQQYGWGQTKLIYAYTTILRALNDHVEILDRGNAARHTDYFAKKIAIERLVSVDELETFMVMQAFADVINSVRNENP